MCNRPFHVNRRATHLSSQPRCSHTLECRFLRLTLTRCHDVACALTTRVRRADVSGTRIHAHRSILAARSDYFSNMFGSQCREAQPGAVVTVGETTPAAFKKLLAYLYSDVLELDDEVVVDVRNAARTLPRPHPTRTAPFRSPCTGPFDPSAPHAPRFTTPRRRLDTLDPPQVALSPRLTIFAR